MEVFSRVSMMGLFEACLCTIGSGMRATVGGPENEKEEEEEEEEAEEKEDPEVASSPQIGRDMTLPNSPLVK